MSKRPRSLPVVLCFLVAAAASAWFSHLYHLDFGGSSFARFLDVFASLGRTTFVIQAVGASLGFYFIEGIFTSLLTNAEGLLARIPDVLFNVNVNAIMRGNGVIGGSGEGGGPSLIPDSGPPGWRALAILCGWLAVLGVAAFWRFQQRDIQE